MNRFEVYSKPNIETVTVTTYERQLSYYLPPAFDGMAVKDITTNDIQRLFNSMDTAKATKDKVKNVLNQNLEATKEDKLKSDNPLKSKRLRITGTAGKATPPYSVEMMNYLVPHIPESNSQATALTWPCRLRPMRLEEALGLQWTDIDLESGTIHICRAVTPPTRNQLEIKCPKTESSIRQIGSSSLARPYLTFDKDTTFFSAERSRCHIHDPPDV